ncbi:MAG: cell division protein ZapE [Silicimonas sp.]|nr:cell division protein ZapE [Silicimonas sp.]
MGVLSDAYHARVDRGELEVDAAQAHVLPDFDRVAEALAAKPSRKRGFFSKKVTLEPVRGLYLWGGVGRGKSMLMDLFHEVAGGEASRRVHFHAFMQEVQARLHEARKTEVEDALVPVARDMGAGLRLLCLDEMQITDIADAMIVGRLFEQMMAAGIAVVTTSNRVPDDLYKDGLNRDLFLPFIALLKDQLEVVELASPRDYRQDRLAGEQVYFTPHDGEAVAALNRLWDEFTGGDEGPLVLNVKSREVELPRFSAGVARAKFYDLCGQPLGPADYLAIAEAARVLFVEDIPRLGSENFNQARRFVTLVDALYEARVRLIASAADIPERLYIEGEGAFEFERTASRLREMQGADWGQ